MSEQQSAVERLAEQWNQTPDWAPTVYDHGRVDQRHEMTMQLLEAIEADRARAVAEEPEWEYGIRLNQTGTVDKVILWPEHETSNPFSGTRMRRVPAVPAGPWVVCDD